jgi:hypothetical protein
MSLSSATTRRSSQRSPAPTGGTDQRLTAGLARARSWLLGAAESLGDGAPLADLLRLQLGLWVCERPRKTASPELRHFVARVAAAIPKENFDPYAYDAKLLLVCGAMARRLGLEPPLEGFVAELGAAFGQMALVPLRYRGETLLLEAWGQPALRGEPLGDLDAFAFLGADATRLRALCQTLSGATDYGRRPLAAAQRQDLSLTLAAVLVQALREYDLEMGALLLRTACHVGMARQPEIEAAARYLHHQQLPDGSFGWLAAEAAAITAGDGDAHAALRRLLLPMTVTCAWALAELGGFRLFSSVGEKK